MLRMLSQSAEYSEKFLHLIARTAQFLCQEGRFGTWGTTRTSGNAVWALSDCGLMHTHQDFIMYCLRQLVESDDCIRDERGVRFNEEVWDTSVALIAIQKGAPGQFPEAVEGMVKWLLAEAQQNNYKNEPWETMWALQALIESGARPSDISKLVRRCLEWVLERRSAQGILISPHYMGFLLMVLNSVVRKFDLTDAEMSRYSEAIADCESYLKKEFLNGMDQGILWGNEPWSIGHILLGIAESPKASSLFFGDDEFNSCLLHWYEQLEWRPAGGGWIDLVETSFTLVGLANYYREREVNLTGGHVTRADVLRQIASLVTFRFEERASQRMTAYPIWRGRKFTPAKNLCFILMPFRATWSDRIYRRIGDIVRRCGLTAKRADEMSRRDIMEDIWSSLNECRLVIAECTGKNPNVFYELGIAHTLGKDVIILTQKRNDIPFDIQQFRNIQYEDNDDGYPVLKKELTKHINALLKGQ